MERNVVTLETKFKIIAELEKDRPQRLVAEVVKSTISDIWRTEKR